MPANHFSRSNVCILMYTFCGRRLVIMKLKWLNVSHHECYLQQNLTIFRLVYKDYLLQLLQTSGTWKSAIADCTVRHMWNVKHASFLLGVGAFGPKFYGNGHLLPKCWYLSIGSWLRYNASHISSGRLLHSNSHRRLPVLWSNEVKVMHYFT